MYEVNFETALRCIGQDLESKGLKTFDIRFEGSRYVVLCGYQKPPADVPVTRHYTYSDIEELDELGQRKRGRVPPNKDFMNQVQVLRTIGGYLDGNDGRLIRVSNNDFASDIGLCRIEYETAEGKRVIDDRAGSAIYDMCVSMYRRRRKKTGTAG